MWVKVETVFSTKGKDYKNVKHIDINEAGTIVILTLEDETKQEVPWNKVVFISEDKTKETLPATN